MFCKTCKKHGKSNLFTKGTNRKREDVLKEHIESKDHVNAYEDELTQNTTKKLLTILLSKNKAKFMILLKIVFYITKEDISFNKYEGMCKLFFDLFNELLMYDKKSKLERPLNYLSTYGFNNFIESLSTTLKNNIISQVIFFDVR